MKTDSLLAKLLVDGFVVVPNVLNEEETEETRKAFERKVDQYKKASLTWNEIRDEPAMLHTTCHPKLIEVVDAFFNFFGQQTTLCHHNGAREAGVREKYSAEKEAVMQGFDQDSFRNRPGWHTDGTCLKDAPDTFAAITITGLLYIDQTFAHNGAFIAAQGSHHLHFGFGTTNGKSKYPDPEFILNNCELRPVPVEPGGVLLFRGHTWHGVLPTHLKHRRLVLQCFCAKAFYDMMQGHNFNESQAEFLPPEKHKYLCSYRKSS